MKKPRICKVLSHRRINDVSKRTGNPLFGTIVNIAYLTPKTRKKREQDALWVDNEVCPQGDITNGGEFECVRARNGYVVYFRRLDSASVVKAKLNEYERG